MKTKIFKILVFALVFWAIGSCQKDDEGNQNSSCEALLPAETTTGANTFGACINGRLLIPRDGTGTTMGDDYGAVLSGGYPNSLDYFELEITDYKSEKKGNLLLHMHAVNLNGLGIYNINQSNGMSNVDGLNHTYLHCMVFDDKTNSYQYYRSYENSGTLKITRYDFTNRIVSGNFSCKLKNSANPNDEIEIKQARFDIKWDTLLNKPFP